ncbi:MAG: amino acid permease, partial [Bacteroidota bacterium]
TNDQSAEIKERVIRMAETTNSRIYVDTIVSPSYTSAIAQIIQFPGITGADNNLLLLEYSKNQKNGLADIMDNFMLIKSVNFNVCILGLSERGFGLKRNIHVWLTNADYENANLMIILAYILMGHPDWRQAQIRIFAIFEQSSLDKERQRIYDLIETGQLPISRNNIDVLCRQDDADNREVIARKSGDADLVILGFRDEALKKMKEQVFAGYDGIGNVLFVNAVEAITIR